MPDPVRLGVADAGELLTLQRAAFVTEARAHGSLGLPPLPETLDEVRAALSDPDVIAWGARESGRLVASVRIRLRGAVGEVSRLPADVRVLRLFTGELSAGPLRRYAKLGYVETGRSPEARYHLVHLAKPLG